MVGGGNIERGAAFIVYIWMTIQTRYRMGFICSVDQVDSPYTYRSFHCQQARSSHSRKQFLASIPSCTTMVNPLKWSLQYLSLWQTERSEIHSRRTEMRCSSYISDDSLNPCSTQASTQAIKHWNVSHSLKCELQVYLGISV